MENYFKDRWFFCLKWFSSKYNKMFHNYGNIWPLVLIFEVFTLRYLRFKLNDSPRTFCETDFFRFSKWHWAHFLWNGWKGQVLGQLGLTKSVGLQKERSSRSTKTKKSSWFWQIISLTCLIRLWVKRMRVWKNQALTWKSLSTAFSEE